MAKFVSSCGGGGTNFALPKDIKNGKACFWLHIRSTVLMRRLTGSDPILPLMMPSDCEAALGRCGIRQQATLCSQSRTDKSEDANLPCRAGAIGRVGQALPSLRSSV